MLSDKCRKVCEKSWTKASSELLKLLRHIRSMEPYDVMETVSLAKVRSTILAMCRPMVVIKGAIDSAVVELAKERDVVFDRSRNIRDLTEQLKIPVVQLVPVALPSPMTVCTSLKCKRRRTDASGKNADSVSTCCLDCDVAISINQLGNEPLRYCKQMNPDGMCKQCECSWDVHMCISYEVRRQVVKVLSEESRKMIASEKSLLEASQAHKQELHERVDALKIERNLIESAIMRCGNFLRKRVIASYNDSLFKYLEYCREVGKDVPEEFQKLHIASAGAVQEAIRGAIEDDEVQPKAIDKMLAGLYCLSNVGPMLKDMMKTVMAADSKAAEMSEKVCSYT